MNSFDVMGKRIPRHDALLQVTGKLIYGDDIYRPNMLYAAATYSEHAHAKILAIDTSLAEKVPGVKGIITAQDVPLNRFGASHKDQPILADDKVRHKGDAVAVVAGETLKAAREGAKKIRVKYEPLEAVFSPREAIQEGAPLVHQNSNIADHIKIRKGDVEKGFQEADFILEEEFSTQKVEQSPIEPHVALAEIENDGKLVIYTSNSRPFSYANQIAKVLNLPMHKFQIKTPAVGGGFGGKNEILLEPWVALLAFKTKRPVKMTFTREEEFTASTVRHPYLMKYKTGFKKDGTLTARQVELISDSGAYVALGKETLTKAAVHGAGPYHIPHVKVDAYLVYTNNIVGGAMRGFGVPQVCFAHECHTDSIAAKLGISPVQIRMINMYGAYGETPTGQTIMANPLRATFQRALELYGGNWRKEG
ncbi:MAG: molybdopterin cofactor-binding domain-containing protein [Dehalobacterium sp.]